MGTLQNPCHGQIATLTSRVTIGPCDRKTTDIFFTTTAWKSFTITLWTPMKRLTSRQGISTHRQRNPSKTSYSKYQAWKRTKQCSVHGELTKTGTQCVSSLNRLAKKS